MHDKTISIIEKLIAVCKKGAEEFELAATEVKSSALQSLLRGYSLQRSRFSGDLETAASALGRRAPAEAAKPRDTIRRSRSDGRDEQAVLLECDNEEEAAVAAYAAALEDPELPSALRTLITAQANDVKGAHKEIHDARTRFVPEEKK